MEVVHCSSEMIKQKGETEKEIQHGCIEAQEQRETLTHLVDRVNQQA